MSVVINEVNLQAFLHDPAGGIAQFLGNVVAPSVLAEAQEFISRPFPGGTSRAGRYPPPGPPYLRTGDLRSSLTVSSTPGPQGTEYDISPTAIHRNANYGLILKERGYRFLPDSYYV